MADSAPGQTGSFNANMGLSRLGRDRLARLVVLGSFLTIFLLVLALMTAANMTNTGTNSAADFTQRAFNVILPVLAGWVGTVLAYYFSAQSQESMSNSLNQAIGQTGGGATSTLTISEKMIPFQSIGGLYDLSKRTPDQIPLPELQREINNNIGKITRQMFVDGNVFRYVMHSSTLNAFLVGKLDPAAANAAPGGSPTLTFADLLRDPDTLSQISKLVVFVKASTTLVEAKAALDAVAGAQDIIVTGSGNASGPMLGWLTNVDLIKALGSA
jgi:hypothetical protein